jgi:hypothetical protein
MRKGEEEGGRGNYLWRRKESAVLVEGDHEVVGGGQRTSRQTSD